MPIRIEKKKWVTTIIMDNPEVKNAVDGPTAAALADAFREFDKDNNARVAVLWGSNGCFCAGANLKAVLQGKGNKMNKEGDGPMGPTRMLLSKPVIAAISGYAVAGGLELAIWCDLRVVEQDAFFGVFSRRFGVPLIDGGTFRLPRLIGLSRALDMIITGRKVGAEEAYDWGLANYLVDKGKSRVEAEKLANKIGEFPQTCLRNDRISAYEQFGMDINIALKNEFKHGLKVIESGETLQGAKRFTDGEGRHGKF
ncbi:MAG: crotonase/enoyl-CoA hydratase family protein [Candidatus Lokiarchaeota archaeon]|nr:crotonase/enoyl-CoA hydratase family protein [Candidatus Lokiarchaeota archaeon]